MLLNLFFLPHRYTAIPAALLGPDVVLICKVLRSGSGFVHLLKEGRENAKGPERKEMKTLSLHCAVQLEKICLVNNGGGSPGSSGTNIF